MPDTHKILNDVSNAAGSAFSLFSGLREEIASIVKGRVDEALSALHLVRREEFEIVSEIASRTRTLQEELEQKIERLEKIVKTLEQHDHSTK